MLREHVSVLMIFKKVMCMYQADVLGVLCACIECSPIRVLRFDLWYIFSWAQRVLTTVLVHFHYSTWEGY